MSRWSWATVWLLACSGGDTDGDDQYPTSNPVVYPETLQSASPSIVIRLTNSATTDPVAYAALNRIANSALVSFDDLLMRGGVPKDEAGAEIVPIEPDHAGTAPQQVAAFRTGGGVTDGAVDACGNPAIAAFVTPAALEHAGGDPATGEDLWPPACGSDPTCNTLQHGTIEVVLSGVRNDGMLDMVVNVFPDVIGGRPALWGHLIGYYLTNQNPGFVTAPVIVNAKQAQLGVFNLWQRTKSYLQPGIGTREVLVLPHTPRTVDAASLLVTLVPQKGDDCAAQAGAFGGTEPYGCREETAVVLDRDAPLGALLVQDFMKDGTDPSNLLQLEQALAWHLKTGVTCPPASEHGAYFADGPVEVIVCAADAGDVDHCLAEHDMEEDACRPAPGTATELVLDATTVAADPIPLAEQRDPYLISNTLLLPFAGPEILLEVTVDADTVLYLPDAARISEVRSATNQPVTLPAPIADTHCAADAPFRYDVGANWAPGTYTLVVPWTILDFDDLRLHVTSRESWVF